MGWWVPLLPGRWQLCFVWGGLLTLVVCRERRGALSAPSRVSWRVGSPVLEPASLPSV